MSKPGKVEQYGKQEEFFRAAGQDSCTMGATDRAIQYLLFLLNLMEKLMRLSTHSDCGLERGTVRNELSIATMIMPEVLRIGDLFKLTNKWIGSVESWSPRRLWGLELLAFSRPTIQFCMLTNPGPGEPLEN